MKPGIYDAALSNEDYHAGPGISSSQLKQVLKNPRAYKWQQDNDKTPPTAAMNLGSLVHSIILEPEKTTEEFTVINCSTRNTKAYKVANQTENKTLMLASEWETARLMAESAMSDDWIKTVMEKFPVIENSIFWERDGMLLKARPDAWLPDMNMMFDVKTAADASPDAFARSVINFGYDLSAAHYLNGAAAHGKPAETFVWLVIESKPPYTTQVYICSDELLERGRVLCNRAIAKLRECQETNVWPGYSAEPIEIVCPRWAQLEN